MFNIVCILGGSAFLAIVIFTAEVNAYTRLSKGFSYWTAVVSFLGTMVAFIVIFLDFLISTPKYRVVMKDVRAVPLL